MANHCFAVSLLAASTLFSNSPAQRPSLLPPTRESSPVSLELHDVTPFNLILQIAKENKIPLGIVLGSHPYLCAARKTMSVNSKDFKEAFAQALAGTSYTTTVDNDTYLVKAPDITEHELGILNFRFDRFSATDSTMNDAGQLLAGYIRTSIEGADTFVTASRVGPLSKAFTIRMLSASTTEIADRIVSQDGKGVWVIRPTFEGSSRAGGNTPIRIYGYDDDAASIAQLGCGGDATR